jgi:hypothetical protein
MMNSLPEDEDARLEVLFSRAAEPVGDSGFSDRVSKRIARNAARRRVVLGVAAIAGLAVAAEPLWSFAQVFSATLTDNTGRFAVLAGWTTDPRLLAAAALLFIAPRLLRWLEE